MIQVNIANLNHRRCSHSDIDSDLSGRSLTNGHKKAPLLRRGRVITSDHNRGHGHSNRVAGRNNAAGRSKSVQGRNRPVVARRPALVGSKPVAIE